MLHVETFNGYRIMMSGFNHFACPQLKLYGFASIAGLKRAINKALRKANVTGGTKNG